MRLSVVIPTRNRAALARRCVASALSAGHDDLQVIVLENSDHRELSCGDFGDDPRVSILQAEKPLAMHVNWERGLEHIDGDYVTYLSDKDVILPGALGNAVKAIELVPDCPVIAFRKPGFVESTGEVFHYRSTGSLSAYLSKTFLEDWYSVPRHYHEMPSIYGAFVSRQLIWKALAAHPCLFIGNSPDVASAVVLCSHTESWAGWEYQVTVGHYGEWSNGLAADRYGFLSEKARRFLRDYGHDIPVELGLPGVLATAIVEVLLVTQAKHPQTLGQHKIAWDEFLPVLRDQLLALDVSREAKRAEWRRLYSATSVAPLTAVIRCEAAWAVRRIRAKVGGVLRRLAGGFGTPPEIAGSTRTLHRAPQRQSMRLPWFLHSGSGSFAAASMEEAITSLATLNARCANAAHVHGADARAEPIT